MPSSSAHLVLMLIETCRPVSLMLRGIYLIKPHLMGYFYALYKIGLYKWDLLHWQLPT